MATSPNVTKTDTAQRESKPNPNAASDVLPDADDDAEPAESPPVSASRTDDSEDDEPHEQVQRTRSPYDKIREEAQKRYRELRDQAEKKDEDAEGSEAAEPPAAQQLAAGAADDKGQEPPATEAAPAKPGATPGQAPAAPVSDKHTLIVDGKPVDMSLDEIRRHAQIALASDNRLEEAKRILQEAKALRGTSPEHQPGIDPTAQGQPDPSPASEGANQPPKLDREKLKAIAERIQVGDAEDGAEATAELIELVRSTMPKSGVEPDKIGEVVRSAIVQERTTTELNDAIGRFKETNQDLIGNEYLAPAAMEAVRREIVEEIVKLGLPHPEADIRKSLPTLESAATAYQTLRSKGYTLPTYTKVLDAGAQKLRTSLGLKAPGTPEPSSTPSPPAKPVTPQPSAAERRLEHKRAQPSQPRSAGVRGVVAPQPQPKTPADYIQEQRKARGFQPSR